MTAPVFYRLDVGRPAPGDEVTLDGEEGRHAVVVRRIRVGETVTIADGAGLGLRGPVTSVGKAELRIRVDERVETPPQPRRIAVVQALAKGDRSELAVEVMTEIGAVEIIPWAASRSVVRWTGERGERSLARWRSTAREAAKQSRRLRIPEVSDPLSSAQVAARLGAADVGLVLHEDAARRLGEVSLPTAGTFVVVVGPEGGIAPDELQAFVAAGGEPVSVSDAVLRTSTAGAVALAQLLA